MSRQDNDVIEPQAAPLSHLQNAAPHSRASADKRTVGMVMLVAAVLGLAVWLLGMWLPGQVSMPQSTPARSAASTAQTEGAAPGTAGGAPALAPFEQTQRQRARETAQKALSAFVERQIQLEDTMNVDGWGGEELAAALQQAQQGDTQFLAEKFDQALASYEQAAGMLLELIDTGNEQADEHIANARVAIDQRQVELAHSELAKALAIRPEDQAAIDLQQRAGNLPQVISKLRTARNHELGGRWDEALALYDEIKTLDPATAGLDELRAGAAARESGSEITRQISAGFSALQNKNFNQARNAFQRALTLDPGNDIAQGGLQQVAQMHDLDIIKRLQTQAEQHMAREQWQQAIDTYEQALQMDANLQFASTGNSTAKAHQRAQRLLQTIVDAPHKLSSEKLYLDAQNILADAQNLQFAGAQLDTLTDRVAQLLDQYRDPVDVVLVSDNATDIIVSNVGRLGAFERKTLALRPGQYTIRGSQDGCRDIYLTVDVLPGIEPLDLSCPDRVN